MSGVERKTKLKKIIRKYLRGTGTTSTKVKRPTLELSFFLPISEVINSLKMTSDQYVMS